MLEAPAPAPQGALVVAPAARNRVAVLRNEYNEQLRPGEFTYASEYPGDLQKTNALAVFNQYFIQSIYTHPQKAELSRLQGLWCFNSNYILANDLDPDDLIPTALLEAGAFFISNLSHRLWSDQVLSRCDALPAMVVEGQALDARSKVPACPTLVHSPT